MSHPIWYRLVHPDHSQLPNTDDDKLLLGSMADVVDLKQAVWKENECLLKPQVDSSGLKVYKNQASLAANEPLRVSASVAGLGQSYEDPVVIVVPVPLHSPTKNYKIDVTLKFSDLLHTVPAASWKRKSRSTDTKETLPTYPRAAKHFIIWNSFAKEVHEFAESELSKYLTMESNITANQLKYAQRIESAGCEADIECSLKNTTFDILEELLRLMGIGSFFSRGKGDPAVILEPDYIWKYFVGERENAYFRLPIEVKPFWSFPQQINLATRYKSDLEAAARSNITHESEAVRGVNQMYGYSSFNCSRYAALTTQHELHCFKRSGVLSTVEISNPIPLSGISYQGNHLSFFTCWLFLLWNAREKGIYASPAGSPPEATIAENKVLRQIDAPIQKLYTLLEIDADQIHFAQTLRIGKGAVGSVVSGSLKDAPELKFKLYDVYHEPNYVDISEREVAIYKQLGKLQGVVIPKFYGYFNYHGILIIAMEDCGDPLTTEEYPLFKVKVDECIAKLLEFGVMHQDLEACDGIYPNILRLGDNIRIIDFHFVG
ncbi:hypothetical protein BDR26DRAFT_2101 [Obelidium mucronatum]|nr:hypothetical protein BDR26DRAFT_2101 [Obelidium mucronatum]